jgi:hypothetical protein
MWAFFRSPSPAPLSLLALVTPCCRAGCVKLCWWLPSFPFRPENVVGNSMGVLLFADVGIPLIGAVVALGWFTIFPVIAIESLMAVWMLRWQVGFAFRWVSLANVVTMLLGFPVMWFLCVLASILTGGGDWGDGSILGVLRDPVWLGPGYVYDLRWAIPFALILLCVPFFLVSWWIEYVFLFHCAAKRDETKRRDLRRYAFHANLASYALLVIFLIVSMFA